MKKVLSLMMMLMLAIAAWAETATFLYTGSGQAEQTVDGITITIAKGNSATDPATNTYSGAHFRIYKDNTITIDAGTRIIESVVFTCTSSSYASNWSDDEATAGTITVSGSTVTLSSVDASITTITHSGAATRITEAVVTYNDGTPSTVAAPTFSPAAGEVEAGTAVTISAPDADLIVYTIDGTTPSYADNVGEIYTEPIVVNEAMTIKAIAVDADENESAVASAAYTIKPQAVTVATVAEFNALADNTEFTFTGSLVATAQTGKYLYAEGGENGILIYGTISQTYDDLAVIPGGWTGKKTTYNGAPEAADPAGLAAATDHADLAPAEMTPAQVTLENAFRYAVIRGATIADGKAWVGNESVTIYDRFGVAAPTDGGVYDIIGVTGYYNNPQFMPLEFVPQGVEVATPEITGETPFVGSTTVTITCATEGASIYYTLDGAEPTNQSTAYNAPFELTESATVKAIAYDATGAASAIASKVFEKTLVISTAAEYNALPENTVFVFNGNLVVSGQKNSYLYAQDATGGVLIYGNAGQTYTKGQVIPAGFTAKKTNYNGTIEMTNMTGMQAATETAELTAAELAINQFADNQNIYAVVKGATVSGNTLTIGEETLAIYNRFGITFPTDDKTYDVYGVTTIFNGAPQLLPLEFVEVVEKTESPVITVEEGDESYVVTAVGNGEVKLYVDEMEVENPYVVVRTSEDQVITFKATAQEEGKEISDPTELTVTVPKLEVVEIEQLFVVGTFNNWSQETGMIELIENENNEFVGDVELEAGAEFKLFTPYGDDLKWFGGVDENNVGYFLINSDVLETPISLVEGSNFRVEEAGNYNITVAEAESKGVQEPLVMTIKKNTPEAIEAINMENVKAVRYYNVAGVESATPFQGVNIVVHEMTDGTKNVTKIVK